MPHYSTQLLSSWTPALLPEKSYYPPPTKVPPQVLSSMKVNEFVGYATLPKELQGRRNVVPTGPKKDQGRFRSGRSRSDIVSLQKIALSNQFLLLKFPAGTRNAHFCTGCRGYTETVPQS